MTHAELREAVAKEFCRSNGSEPGDIDYNGVQFWHEFLSDADIALSAIGKACAEVAESTQEPPERCEAEEYWNGYGDAKRAVRAAILTLTGARDDG